MHAAPWPSSRWWPPALAAASTTRTRRRQRGPLRPGRSAATHSPRESGVGAGKITIPGAEPEDGQWLRPAKDYASTRFSGLDQITTANASQLKLAWSFSTGVLRGQEAAPLIVGSTMYVVTPYPNILYALDLTKPGAPAKWKYEPQPLAAAQGVACCDVVNRGAAFADGKIFYNTLDNQTVAVDANTGKEVWRTQLGDINNGETITMAPLVVKGKVLVGNSGGEFGVRGWLTALDASDGQDRLARLHTGPDSRRADRARSSSPSTSSDQGKDLGVTTWPPDSGRSAAATVLGLDLLRPDAQSDLLRHGEPGPVESRAAAGRQQVDVDDRSRATRTRAKRSGRIRSRRTTSTTTTGSTRASCSTCRGTDRRARCSCAPSATATCTCMDRATGEVLSADAVRRRELHVRRGSQDRPPSPSTRRRAAGGQGGAQTSARLRPERRTGSRRPGRRAPGCSTSRIRTSAWTVETVEANYIAGTPYVGANVKMYAGPAAIAASSTAWDPIARKKVWSVTENFPVWSGTLVTAGDVVFYGTMDGWFKALDARTGKLLWQSKLGRESSGSPSRIAGRTASSTSQFSPASAVGPAPSCRRASTRGTRARRSVFVNAMRDLPNATTKGGTLYVFGLP